MQIERWGGRWNKAHGQEQRYMKGEMSEVGGDVINLCCFQLVLSFPPQLVLGLEGKKNTSEEIRNLNTGPVSGLGLPLR